MAQTNLPLTKQPAPQTVPPCELPLKVYDVARNTGPYTSAGLATAGFRTAKYLADEWFQSCYARYHQAFAGRSQSEQQRHESRQLAAETEALAQRSQQDCTRSVGARLQDTHCWKAELQRQVDELVAETDLLLAQKRRLERALDATALPLSLATDNLQCRERRQHPDLVRDPVEMELLKEAELTRNIQGLLKRTILQVVNQIRLNREHKQTCELDWSDKVEAYNIDQTCAGYSNQSTEVQAHPHSARLEESLAFGRRWEELEDALHTLQHHLRKTLREITDQEHNVAALRQAIRDKEVPLRVAQSRLYLRSHRPNVELCRDAAQFRCPRSPTPDTAPVFRGEASGCIRHASDMHEPDMTLLVACVLQDVAEDLRLQCDAVNLAFGRRCEELEDALHTLQHHLRKTLREITDQEHNVAALRQAIRDKEVPLRVAQSRLYLRSHRPNVELCRDAAQFRLVSEVEELNLSLKALREKLLEAEQSLRNLEDTRMGLEKDIAVKTNSLFIDRQKCMAHRARYPTVLQLAGYQ
ncbi:tektin-4 [Tupaia chinensis]|uniref:tektin-4 n=1 Tax=Tupaia chinensis TaxID=246437 RepID=UPI0003C8D66F|nr:tektin-4 [Tupaia chinensis]